jgi:hypothetical protein
MIGRYGLLLILFAVLTFTEALTSPADEKGEKAKVPPVNEGLVPYAFSKQIESHLNKPFPFDLPSNSVKGFNPKAKEDYKNYWKKWDTLWASLDSFNTLFSQADNGLNSLSVQYLSARISNFLLLYQQAFPQENSTFASLESYKRLRSMAQHLEALRFVLQKQGRIYTELRPFQNDVEEETLAYQRLFLQVKQDLDVIQDYRDVAEVFVTGFRKTDK